ncbi:MAG: hypothetical protein CMO80_20860 [Verrucomicrobiales bacterium]|nr:hypothetical protein [Verrucomicrobiales bacterium]|tara:strand:- start:1402 stop:2241 length:840 start_codon:yes stop_codon:yes gene_type:complete
MIRHLPFAIVTIFFVVMNYKLYQKDFKQTDTIGTPIPLEMVWNRMLRSPDESFLYMFQDKRRRGSLRWSAEAVEYDIEDEREKEYLAEGMVRNPANYIVEIRSGHLLLGQGHGTVNFDMSANFSTNNQWHTFELGLHQKPIRLQFVANSTNETLRVSWLNDDHRTEHNFTFDELKDPSMVVTRLIGPLPLAQFAGGLLAGFGSGDNPHFNAMQLMKSGIKVEAFDDRLKIGHTSLRCYRVSVTLPDQRVANIYVSRIGEILRITLPDKIEIRNARLLLL